MSVTRIAFATLIAGALSACATAPKVSPVEVTRFHQSAAMSQLGNGTIFIEDAAGQEADPAEMTAFKSAVAAELIQLGYREVPRSEASQIAQVRLDRFVNEPSRGRSPVTVGGGGSVGSYGSGVGLGIGINLGGGPRTMLGTDLGVMIRQADTNDVIWEGRANFTVSDNSSFADTSANASAIADALFREFPGNNGETVEVGVAK